MKNPESRQASSGFQQMSFLPELKFNPKHPNPHTQPAKALDYFGWPIESADAPCPQGSGTSRPINEYWLPIKRIKQVNQSSLSCAHADYGALKQRWDSNHIDATSSQRDAALMRLAQECGV